eukprot:Gregarina_sp_Poly_1__3927@NODE_2179_length_2542_cov_672_335354_g1404_i0_p1_GENE_NODE_2179_length_2542_cov_672_335354_g1404_i0NODE_2179_length_2542_cov_672_335354_g1404_i0_p1_ORF_typecomplete_len329_score40_88PNP_UDP_1/PF01048_20/2e19_NODE_2179_length_2542_cov_672_335354_g1404_i03831369
MFQFGGQCRHNKVRLTDSPSNSYKISLTFLTINENNMTTSNDTYMSGKTVLLMPDGSTYHLGVKKGDLYPRIVTVGSPSRAESMSKMLDVVEKKIVSSRLMYTYSGKYKGVGVSIIAIGMGAPMLDFMIREATYVMEEPIAVIRVGTCGLFNPELVPGTVVCAGKGCCFSYVNYAAVTDGCFNDDTCSEVLYQVTKPILGSSSLNSKLYKALETEGVRCCDGLNVAGEFFFATQGRDDGFFDDKNSAEIPKIFADAKIDSCEMESFTLFHLAQIRKSPMYAAACHIGILNRANDEMPNITADLLHELERKSGVAAVEALIDFNLEKGE